MNDVIAHAMADDLAQTRLVANAARAYVNDAPTYMDSKPVSPAPGVRHADLRPADLKAPDGLNGHAALASFQAFDQASAQRDARTPAQVAAAELDRARLEVLSHPVPSETKAAAEMARAMPVPKTLGLQPPSAEQVQILKFGEFAPVASRVHNNETGQMETHWALHPWDVVRLAEQASADVFRERHIKVDPKLIGAAYYTESAGVVQQGWDIKGVDLLEKGKSTEHVAKSGAKASFGLFQLDERGSGDVRDIDPVKSAKRAALLLAEGQDNARAHPELGMLAVSATYNASSNLRAKIFSGAPLSDKERDSLAFVQRHAANMSYGASLYEKASTTYHQHLVQAQRQGMPIAVAADSVRRADPLQAERVGAVNALTGRTHQGINPTPGYAPDNIVLPDPQPAVRLRDGTTFKAAEPTHAQTVPGTAVNALSGRPAPAASETPHPTIQQIERMAQGPKASVEAETARFQALTDHNRDVIIRNNQIHPDGLAPSRPPTDPVLAKEEADIALKASMTFDQAKAAVAKEALPGGNAAALDHARLVVDAYQRQNILLGNGKDEDPAVAAGRRFAASWPGTTPTPAPAVNPQPVAKPAPAPAAERAPQSAAPVNPAQALQQAADAIRSRAALAGRSATPMPRQAPSTVASQAVVHPVETHRVVPTALPPLDAVSTPSMRIASAPGSKHATATPRHHGPQPTPQQLERQVAKAAEPTRTMVESLREEASTTRRAAEAAQQALVANAERGRVAMRQIQSATNALTTRRGNEVIFHNDQFDKRRAALGDASVAGQNEAPLQALVENATQKAERNEMIAHAAEKIQAGAEAGLARQTNVVESFKTHLRSWRADAASLLERVGEIQRDRMSEGGERMTP